MPCGETEDEERKNVRKGDHEIKRTKCFIHPLVKKKVAHSPLDPPPPRQEESSADDPKEEGAGDARDKSAEREDVEEERNEG